MRALQNAQKEAIRIEKLSGGRVRYYEKETPSRTPGPTRGSAYVTEHNPKTGQVRTWYESRDHAGNVNRIHLKTIDGQNVNSHHYPPTKAELESWIQAPKGPK